MIEDAMVGWHHRHNGHGFGVDSGQKIALSLSSPCRERDTLPTQGPPRPGKEESHVTGSQAPPALLVFFQ